MHFPYIIFFVINEMITFVNVASGHKIKLKMNQSVVKYAGGTCNDNDKHIFFIFSKVMDTPDEKHPSNVSDDNL